MNGGLLMRFEIHSHSMYSNLRLIDSINKPRDLIQTAYNKGLTGITLTDHECISGHINFLQEAQILKEKKLISEDFKIGLGNEIYLVDSRDSIEKYFHLVLIAKNTKGHEAIRKLSSIAWYNSYNSKGMRRVPTTKAELRKICEEYPDSLIISSACLGSEVAARTLAIINEEKKKDPEAIYAAKKKLLELINYFKELVGEDFYLEVAPSSSPDQKKYNRRIYDIAKALNVKVVFGGDAHFLTEKDRMVHSYFLKSKNGEREVDEFYRYAYLMDDEEAFKNCGNVFAREEFEEICNNSIEIQQKIGEYNLFHNPIIPSTELPEIELINNTDLSPYPTLARVLNEGTQAGRYWVKFCLNKLLKINKNNPTYLSRLETEADVIDTLAKKLENDLFSYFTTFQSYIDLFWENGSIVGPGRGSAVSYLSNYLLGITQLDPIVNNLDYWRFLNKERAELPDIDIDLAPSKRPQIFQAIRNKIGETNLLQVATFSTATTKRAVLTSCRGYGIDIDVAQYMADLIPKERGFLWPLSDVIYGNEEKGRAPIKSFLNAVNQYEGLLDCMQRIEGLIVGNSQHASGVIIYNQPCYKTGALMRSPTGALTTQYELHTAELTGDTKFDFLVTEVIDKITTTIGLLQKDDLLPQSKLREIYDKYLHPDCLNLEDSRMWDALANGEVIDVFQFSTAVGLHAAQTIKPRNPIEMMMANALTRLVGEKGKEMPIDRYVRLKNDISQWYSEIHNRGLTEEEIKVIEPYYLPASGCPTTQEKLMLLCMDKNIAGFSLAEANKARKICAKKKLDQVASLKKEFLDRCPRRDFGEYIWETAIEPQMSYSFAEPHALAYSYVGIQTLYLATNYPIVYWNTAVLISDAGGEEETDEFDELGQVNNLSENNEFKDTDDEEDDEDDVEAVAKDNKQKKSKSVNFGKVATAIGRITSAGINVEPPNINSSSYTFSPDVKNNAILYGLSGITRVGEDLIKSIIKNRPYSSINDFLSKVKTNKPQMINLIKSGAFDCFGNRDDIMHQYIDLISDAKKRITLQNMKMLIDFGLIPEEYDLQRRVFNFNKYIKKLKLDTTYYGLDNIAFRFYESNFDVDKLIPTDETESGFKIKQTIWDGIYKKQMDIIRPYVKEHNAELLLYVNNRLTSDMWNKYCTGNISKWEMDSVSFYSHPHELAAINNELYGIEDFFSLSEQPEIDRYIPIKGKQVPLFKLKRIAGTVLDRDKAKKTVTLLTTTGVVIVKVYGCFENYDRQISEKGPDGKKHIIEKSAFSRGNKIIVTGIRSENDFIAKVYKATPYHRIEQIVDVDGERLVIKADRGEEV